MRGRRVLIVDDEREIAELIAGQLVPLGVNTEIASSGPEALADAAPTGASTRVTLDLLMPGMDGFEVLRRIRADPELAAVPIVFVSVFSGRRELAGEWVVSKPIDADELRQVLGAAVQAGRSRVLVVARPELESELEPRPRRRSGSSTSGSRPAPPPRGPARSGGSRSRSSTSASATPRRSSRRSTSGAGVCAGRRSCSPTGARRPRPGIARLGIEVVPLDEAAAAVDAALQDERVG